MVVGGEVVGFIGDVASFSSREDADKFEQQL